MMFLRLLLILSSVVSIASQFKCTVLGCPKDNNLLGFVTLEDLQCAMQQEYDIVMSDTDTVSTGTGQPMYSYVLCPDTDFAGEPIVPLLNDTILSCASKEQGSCRIEAQVLLINNLNNVQFKDLTFSGGNFSISVLATSHAKQNSTALFQNCHWLNRTWAIENVNLTSPEKMMHISLNDCTMTDSDTTDGSFTYGIRSYGGSITATNLTVSNYNVSRFMDIRDAASVTIREATFASSTIKDPDAFDDFIFVENDATLLLDTIDATDNRFANFVWAQSSAQVEVIRSQMYDNRGTFGALFRMTGSAASLTIRNCDLSGAGFSLVSVSGNGPTLTIEGSVFGTESRNNKHAIWSFTDTFITDSCFHGTTLFPPIFVAESEVIFNNVFSDVEVERSNCTGLFIEQNGDECFYPNGNETCDGECVTLDADSCSTNRYPPAPTCNLDCPIFPNIGDCANTLRDLRCVMCVEARAIASGANMRSPPYVYRLCPNTFFSINNETEDVIFPILNGTRILCGTDGDIANNCTIDSGVLQVEIGQVFRDPNDSFVSPLPLKSVEISGLSFTNGIYDSRLDLSPSIWTRAPQEVVAVFQDCRWSGGIGSNLLASVNGDGSGGTSQSASVLFSKCVFENIVGPPTHEAIYSVSGTVAMTNVQVKNYALEAGFGRFEDSTFVATDVTFSNSTTTNGGEVSVIKSTLDSSVKLTRCEVRGNSFSQFLLVKDGSAYVDESIFSDNEGTVDVFASGSSEIATSLTLRNCTFEETKVANLVVVNNASLTVDSSVFIDTIADIGIEGANMTLKITDTCFLGGEYTYPVFVRDSDESFENVYGENIVALCSGIAISDSDNCLDVFDCPASCVDFDADSCFLVPHITSQAPSAAPSAVPITKTAGPTDSSSSCKSVRAAVLGFLIATSIY